MGALLAGGAMLLGAIGQGAMAGMSAQQQAEIAAVNAARARSAGQAGIEAIKANGARGLGYSQFGTSAAQNAYNRAQQNAAQTRGSMANMFAAPQATGNAALQRYTDAVLGRSGSAPIDAGYQQRLGAGAQGMASMAGSMDPRVAAALSQYNANVASTDWRSGLSRQQALASLGTQGAQAQQGIDLRTLQALQNIQGARAAEAAKAGDFESLYKFNQAISAANAANNQATNISAYNLDRANALAYGGAAASNATTDLLQNLAMLAAMKGGSR